MVELLKIYQNLHTNNYFILYLAVLFSDIIVGNVTAWLKHKWDSNVGMKGTIKHLSVLLMVIILLPVVELILPYKFKMSFFDMPVILNVSNTIMIYITYQNLFSLIENLGYVGIPVPSFIKNKMYRLNDEINTMNIEEIKTKDIKIIK